MEFTKEQLQQIEAAAKEVLWPVVWSEKKAREHFSEKITPKVVLKLARIALASLEAEPVALRDERSGSGGISKQPGFNSLPHGTPLYTSQPASINAEPVAWLWSHRKHPSEVTLVSPEDDDKAEAAHWSGWSYKALYAAPPAPVAVPDFKKLARELVENLVDCDGADDSAVKQYLKWTEKTCRAAMLQGTEPVTTGCKLPELTDSQCLEFLAVAFRHNRIKGDIEFDDIRLGLKMALEAAPRQE